jgi:phosphatidylglycerol:prolipoprotein diacylglycerol transferase
VLGVVLGGRLGQVVFYEPGYYLAHPLEIFMVWKGGMAFHGGMLGVFVAMALWARKTGRTFFEVTDFIAPLVPLGADGRAHRQLHQRRTVGPRGRSRTALGHGLPPGRSAAAPSLAALPGGRRGPAAVRHPLGVFRAAPRARRGVGVFMVGYGTVRFLAEFFREPDHGIFGWSYVVSMGQWLSLPMVLFGLWLLSRKAPVNA